MAGNKAGRWKRCYAKAIPRAEHLYQGGIEEAERRGLTRAQLAPAMSVTPGRVSQIERGELATIDAVARSVDALGGRLDLVASFGDHTLTIATTEAA